MNVIELIDKKRLAKELSYDEIKYLIINYLNGEIKDYQMSSLLMAICINGMTEKETFYLTEIMLENSEKIDFSNIEGIKVDKHSTGGVGDKTTLIVAPIVSSCGVKVAKMSGRGLGFTGGTIDKLESIKGFNTNLSIEEFSNQVNAIGVAISSATLNLVPVDKKLYELRDVTGTVSSIPLIAASIMSKKIATGADKILLDVKVGKGAFIKTKEEAFDLANMMIKIGNHFNKETVAILSNMDFPLGNNIGNSLEVIEAIEVLNNKGNNDLREFCLDISSYMVSLAKEITLEEAKKIVEENLNNGKAYQKFRELVRYQKGNLQDIEVHKKTIVIKSLNEGYIKEIDAYSLANIALELGAGRKHKNDLIDYSVGICLKKTIGSFVKKGDVLLKIYGDSDKIVIDKIYKAFNIVDEEVDKPSLIYTVIGI